MRWIVKTSLNGEFFDDVVCDGARMVPEDGCNVLIPVDGHYTSAVVSEVTVDKSQTPALLRIVCLSPEAFVKS